MIEGAALAVAVIVLAGLGLWSLSVVRPRRRFSIVRRVVVAGIVAVTVVLFSVYKIINARTFQFFGEIVPRVETSQPIVALTFDDGPTPPFTDEILAILREKQVKATFFVTGADLGSNPSLGPKIVSEGHELGNHSYTHDRMVLKSPAFIRDEIEKTDELIRRAGYAGQIHFRSPFGKKFLLLPLYLSRANKKNIFWDVEPESYDGVAVESGEIVDHVIEESRPGSIILLHVMYQSRAESMKAVPGIIDGLRAKGYSFKTVTELLAEK